MDNQIRHPITIGKLFRRNKGLKVVDKDAVVIEEPKKLQKYRAYLQTQGLEVFKLQYARFKLKNGLPYNGLIATEKILSNETLVRVPVKLLFNTKDAFLSELEPMFRQYPQFFASNYHANWEDRVQVAYLLHEYQKGKNSKWYHLIKNLPKEIDTFVFWSDQEQQIAQDSLLIKESKRQYRDFILEYEAFKIIAAQYPKIYDQQFVTFENYRWLYIQIVTRAFGKNFNFVTMVPFCELFNHECVDVYYDSEYLPTNKHYEENIQPQQEPEERPQGHEESFTTSEGSYDSRDDFDEEYLEGNQFGDSDPIQDQFSKYLEQQEQQFVEKMKASIEDAQLKQTKEESMQEFETRIHKLQEQQIKERREFNVRMNLQKELNLLQQEIKKWAYNNIDFGDLYFIFILGQFHKKLEKSLQEYNSGQKAYFMTREDMKRVQYNLTQYQEYFNKFMKDYMKKRVNQNSFKFAQKCDKSLEKQFENGEEILQQTLEEGKSYYQDKWDDEDFDSFVMKTSRKDQFQPGSQVYFCYGRISNKSLLLRYGCALEHNKYDHVYLIVDYLKYINTDQGLEVAYKSKLPKTKRIILRQTHFPAQLVIFCKASLWTFNVHSMDSIFDIQDIKLETSAFQRAIEILTQYIDDNFKQSEDQLQQTLLKQDVGYHDYFSTVYQLEQLRICKQNLILLKMGNNVLEYLNNGDLLKVALEKDLGVDAANEYLQAYKIMVKKYFTLLRNR